MTYRARKANRNPRTGRSIVGLVTTLCVLLALFPSAQAQTQTQTQTTQYAPDTAPRPITGGTEIGVGDYPYLAAILYSEDGELQHGCGGTLIAPRWVLSAKHCFAGVNSGVFVALGSPDRTNPRQRIPVSEIVRGPGGRTMDLAMLRLAWPADVSQSAIGLARYATQQSDPAIGTNATVLGWGDTDPTADGETYVEIARKAVIVIERCDNNVGNVAGGPENQQDNVCGWNSRNRDACFRDSGGPLISRIKGVATLVATVESGPNNYTCGLIPYGVYHRIAPHHGWIQQTIAADAQATCEGLPVTINMRLNGGFGEGTNGDDVILGTSGNDIISAGAGHDTICAGDGADQIDAGPGNDVVSAGAGNDTIRGGTGRDELHGHAGNDTIRGEDGPDIMKGGEGNDDVYGGEGNDIMSGGIGRDELDGQKGNDTITGDDGADLMMGGAGDDVLIGGSGGDTIVGGAGDDEMRGGAGADDMRGNSGADEMFGGGGNDFMRGENGNDVIEGQIGVDSLFGDIGNDTLDGGRGDDTLNGGQGSDTLNGGRGDDTLNGGQGNDTCEGVTADDTAQGCATG